MQVIVILGIAATAALRAQAEEMAPSTAPTTAPTTAPSTAPVTSLFDAHTVVEWVDGANRMYAMPFERAGVASDESVDTTSDMTSDTTSDTTSDMASATMWQFSFPMAEEEARELSSRGGGALLAEARQRCSAWCSPAVHALLAATRANDVTGYPIYDRLSPYERAVSSAAAAAPVPPEGAPYRAPPAYFEAPYRAPTPGGAPYRAPPASTASVAMQVIVIL